MWRFFKLKNLNIIIIFYINLLERFFNIIDRNTNNNFEDKYLKQLHDNLTNINDSR